MTEEKSFKNRERSLKGRFLRKNNTAAVKRKLHKMNRAREKCKRKLETKDCTTEVEEDAEIKILTRIGLVSTI